MEPIYIYLNQLFNNNLIFYKFLLNQNIEEYI